MNVSSFTTAYSKFKVGVVNHALAAAMQKIVKVAHVIQTRMPETHNRMKEHLVLVAQLENQFRNGNLTLQRLLFYIQPSLSSMTSLESLCKIVQESQCKGGSLLNLLHDHLLSLSG